MALKMARQKKKRERECVMCKNWAERIWCYQVEEYKETWVVIIQIEIMEIKSMLED